MDADNAKKNYVTLLYLMIFRIDRFFIDMPSVSFKE